MSNNKSTRQSFNNTEITYTGNSQISAKIYELLSNFDHKAHISVYDAPDALLYSESFLVDVNKDYEGNPFVLIASGDFTLRVNYDYLTEGEYKTRCNATALCAKLQNLFNINRDVDNFYRNLPVCDTRSIYDNGIESVDYIFSLNTLVITTENHILRLKDVKYEDVYKMVQLSHISPYLALSQTKDASYTLLKGRKASTSQYVAQTIKALGNKCKFFTFFDSVGIINIDLENWQFKVNNSTPKTLGLVITDKGFKNIRHFVEVFNA